MWGRTTPRSWWPRPRPWPGGTGGGAVPRRGAPGPPEGARAGFRRLAKMAADLGLPELSMGMTDDLEVAVQEGATMVRVGRGLFGPRPVHRDMRRLGSERGGV